MLGQPVTMLIPEVIGFRLEGALREGVTATDLVLTVAEMLRTQRRRRKVRRVLRPGTLRAAGRRSNDDRQHVAGVRFDGRDLPDRRSHARVPAPDRPVRGADRAGRSVRQGAGTLSHRRDARSGVHRYARRSISRAVEPSLAGPRRPQDRVPLRGRQAIVRRRAARVGRRTRARQRRGRALRGRRRRRDGDDRADDRGRRRRRGRDRGDHELHEHVESVGADRRRTARAKCRRARASNASRG